ncbi:MAG TPA: hypothetical protein QGI22_01180 [Candidatus Woesearchaeota archaeon]|jgi:hypothetical protein|nr:hypothetical protein [Candidatus Woesearchaeota archaeon]HJN56558.1 hypothetical protein [Candidatus Woesearchaeota archaeon]|tara:strand:- start:18 stop:542 length:525 start_codon:yes stop_codon:yes gene_type:complete
MADDENIKELKDELRKLNPKAKIKKLKDLEERRKYEINEIETLIKNSENELKMDSVAEKITPKQDEVNIGKLFEEENSMLEGTVKKEAPEEDDNKMYMSFKQVYNDYSELKDITYAGIYGKLTNKHMEAIDTIGERLDKSKYHSATNEVADILVASKAALYKIKKYAGLNTNRV